MDLKNKIKQSGIKLAKRAATNKRSSKGRLVENLLETTAKDKAKSAYSKPLSKVSDKINSTTVGNIANNVVDVPGIVQDKLDSQVDRAIKSFKTPSTKSEIEKHKKDITKTVSNSGIGRTSTSVKEKLESNRNDGLESLLENSVKEKLSELTKDILDVNRKAPKQGKNISITGNTRNNPQNDRKKYDFENKAIKIDATNKNEPKLKFRVIVPDSVSDGDQNNQKKKANAPKRISHQFSLPIQGNQLNESFSFSYDTDQKIITKDNAALIQKGKEGLTTFIDTFAPDFISNAAGAAEKLALRQKGIVQNPNIEQVFQNVDIRAFSFEFSLFPKSEVDYNNYLEIIHLLKYHSHPSKSFEGFYLNYPKMWEISLEIPEKNNYSYTRHAYCNEIEVKWGGGSEFLLNNDGNFSAIELKLGFLENEILTQDDIQDKFLTKLK